MEDQRLKDYDLVIDIIERFGYERAETVMTTYFRKELLDIYFEILQSEIPIQIHKNLIQMHREISN